ncbi:Uncharacterised protein [Citrobacter braakii]|uniref:Ref family recombination enhancement nuclease n=1 Tax=Citrobacter braakii TaxID=57706 RepID=UPI000E002AEA|nr:Ref family recombination enhancement nuclease [Citrobacter braakii]STJ26712.1 Uncharacterised protein [Citrobacter braakii]
MNGRTPTKAERLYINACLQLVGCIPCILDGLEIENPEAWTEFHHDPDYGSTDKNCHFHGYGICMAHHRGAPAGVAVRHPIASNGPRFATVYGPDELLCAMAWERIPDAIKATIGFDLSTGEIPANFK